MCCSIGRIGDGPNTLKMDPIYDILLIDCEHYSDCLKELLLISQGISKGKIIFAYNPNKTNLS